jgi:hypothetical protein
MKASQDGTHVTGDKTRMENELTRDGEATPKLYGGSSDPYNK